MRLRNQNQQNNPRLLNISHPQQDKSNLNNKKTLEKVEEKIQSQYQSQQKSDYNIFNNSFKLTKEQYFQLQKNLKNALNSVMLQKQQQKPMVYTPTYGSNDFKNIQKTALKMNAEERQDLLWSKNQAMLLSNYEKDQFQNKLKDKNQLNNKSNELQILIRKESQQFIQDDWDQYQSQSD